MQESAAVIEREPNGHFKPGCATPNQKGLNQYTSPGARVRKRLERASLRELGKRECVETIVENLISAMKDPESKPVSAKLAYERLWPVLKELHLNVGRTDGGAPPDSSASQWAELAERADREIIDVEAVARREPDEPAIDGAD